MAQLVNVSYTLPVSYSSARKATKKKKTKMKEEEGVFQSA